MADVLTPEERRRCMSAIRGKDTKPELVVRRIAHSLGYRYRLHSRNLPGRPDLVFGGRRKAIFVNGCFWHMHNCRYGRVRPATNSAFWENKRLANVARDRRSLQALRRAGWRVLVVWECRTRKPGRLPEILGKFLRTDPVTKPRLIKGVKNVATASR